MGQRLPGCRADAGGFIALDAAGRVQIAGWLQAELEPNGVGVVLEAEHRCMSLRGVQKLGARTVTSALRGARGESADAVVPRKATHEPADPDPVRLTRRRNVRRTGRGRKTPAARGG
jgi:hypothetical protein